MTGSAPKVVAALLLVGLFFYGPLAAPDPGTPLRVDADTDAPELARALADRRTPVVYLDARPPSGALAAVIASAEAVVEAPGRAPTLELDAPLDPIAGRRAALTLTVRGEPGERRTVSIESTAGIVDTVSVVIGPEGAVRTQIGIEPGREGALSWTARSTTDDEGVVARAWVRPPSPVRVLVLTGPPGLESRHLTRALEAAGVEVEVRTELGRGLGVATDGAVAPASPDDLEPFDVVALVEPVEAPVDMLTRWVAERGGGLLGITPGTSTPATGGTLTWSGPAEIVPLPESEPGTGLAPVPLWPGAERARTVDVVRDADDVPIVRAGWLGRGRLYVSSLPTWPWVMEAGQEVEHRRHWESVVEWLAGGLNADHLLMPGGAIAGEPWSARIDGVEPFDKALRLSPPSPTAPREDQTLHPVDGTLFALPRVAGAYTLHEGGDPADAARFGFVAAPSDAPLTWADAALLIGGASGSILSRGDTEDGAATAGRPLGSQALVRVLLFVALATVVGGSWVARRVTGLT